jgi:16S rRNA (guanine527-N7)-methyltransferase
MNGAAESDRSNIRSVGERLSGMLEEAQLAALEPAVLRQFETYLSLLVRWNSRTNLTAVRDEDGILRRHFVESIACAAALPGDVKTLLDFGSGGGLPGIPIALCRPEIIVTLAESQGKKAAFLQEAVRVLKLRSRVHPGRAEKLTELFSCVVLRAVDRMKDAVAVAQGIVSPGGWMGLLTSEGDEQGLRGAAGGQFSWLEPVCLPGSDQRILLLGSRAK